MSDSLEKTKPFVFLDILGEQRKFRFSFWSLAQFKKLRGKSLLEQGFDAVDAEELAVLLWCGLIPDNEDLDGDIDAQGVPEQKVKDEIKKILKSLDLSDYPRLTKVIQEAIALGQPKVDPKKKEKPVEEKAKS